ncbi:MAG: AcrR family transcriptional regulator [Bacteroidia bacterium]
MLEQRLDKPQMREQILEKTAEMFERYGVRSVTMDDIANKIAISKKTIYQHFKDKKEIVKESVRFMMDKDHCKILFCQKEAKDEIHELVMISQMFREQVKNMNPSLLFDLKKYHSEGWNVYLEMKEKCYNASIKESLERGKKSGLFRKEIDADVIARVRMVQVESGFDPDIFPSNEYDITEVQMQLFHHFLYGIVTKEGLELFEKYTQELDS